MPTDDRQPSNGWTIGTLKVLHDEQIDATRQTSWERFGFVVAIGTVVVFEIYRRLGGLNHENARVAAMTAASVSADTYRSDEQRRKDEREKLDEWRKVVDIKTAQAVTREDVKKTDEDYGRGKRSEKRDDTRLWIAVAAIAVTIVFSTITIVIARQRAAPVAPPVVVTPTVTAPVK